MTHRDGLPRFSARSVRRGDAGHRKPRATLSESLGKPPARSSIRPVGGRRKALTMPLHRPRLPSYPTSRMDDPYGSLSPLLGIIPVVRARCRVAGYGKATGEAELGTPIPTEGDR